MRITTNRALIGEQSGLFNKIDCKVPWFYEILYKVLMKVIKFLTRYSPAKIKSKNLNDKTFLLLGLMLLKIGNWNL